MDKKGFDGILLDMQVLKLGQCRNGLMLFMPHDYYIGKALDLYGEFSHQEAALFDQIVRPGDFVVDVGANIGCHTLRLARLATNNGRTLAFEPQRAIYYLLAANLALNGLVFVEAYQMALGAGEGSAGVPPLDYNEPNNFGGVSLVGAATDMVPMKPLDSFHLPKCNFVKIDVEGMELSVLKGADDTIKRCQPFLYVENDRKDKSQALIEHLWSLDYKLYWHVPLLFNPRNVKENLNNIYGNAGSYNMLCVPKRISQRSQFRNFELVERSDIHPAPDGQGVVPWN